VGKTSIEWTDHSVNPVRFGRGHFCQKISPGCAACYASRLQPRFGNPEFGGVGSPAPVVIPNGVTDGQYLWLDPAKLREVLNRRKPTRYFWCDMTDLFGPWVPDEFIDRCFATMALTPQHTHQVLTKRPERMELYATKAMTFDNLSDEINRVHLERTGEYPCRFAADDRGWPLPNVWLGVSVEDQRRADDRIPHLLRTPAAVRFLSCEPLLGPVDLRPKAPDAYAILGKFYDTGTFDPSGMSPAPDRVLNCFPKVDWVIVGGESGRDARPCDLAWVRSLVRQCREARVSCFVKQLGACASDPPNGIAGRSLKVPEEAAPLVSRRLRDPKGGDMTEFPDDLKVRQFPEAAP
jgi:protein gp37